MDIFSGRANPAWQLSDDDVGRLLARVGALGTTVPVAFVAPLGYRGFIVRVEHAGEPIVVQAQRGLVRTSRGGADVYSRDPRRTVERFLLDSGRPVLDAEIHDAVARDLSSG